VATLHWHLVIGEPDVRLRERAVRAIAEIIESPSGALWLRRDGGQFEAVAAWQMEIPTEATEHADSSWLRFWAARVGDQS